MRVEVRQEGGLRKMGQKSGKEKADDMGVPTSTSCPLWNSRTFHFKVPDFFFKYNKTGLGLQIPYV